MQVEAVRHEGDEHFERPENAIDKAIMDIIAFAQEKIEQAFEIPENRVDRFNFPMVVATLVVNLSVNLLGKTLEHDGKTSEIRMHMMHGYVQGVTAMMLNAWTAVEEGIEHRDEQH